MKRGATVCDNALVKRVAAVEDALRSTLAHEVLRPAVVKTIIHLVFEALQPTAVVTNVRTLTKELQALDVKIANLTAAVENGKAVAPLIAKLQARQTERDTLLAEIGAAEAMQAGDGDPSRASEQQVLAKVANWRALLRQRCCGAATGAPRDRYGPTTRGRRARPIIGSRG